MIDIIDNFLELRNADTPVIVNVEQFKNLSQVLLRAAIRHDIDDKHEFSEVNYSILGKTRGSVTELQRRFLGRAL